MLHRLVPTTPATRRGGELFLALAVFAVIVQLPGNVIVSLVLPPIALLINGIQAVGRRGEWCVWLWTLLTLIPATIAVIRWDLLMERPYLLQVIAVTLAAVVTLRGSQGTDGARALMQGMYAGFAALALIGVAEVITGFKLLFLRYPDSVVASWAAADRLITTAMYPNYNDFSVALVLLGLFLGARFLAKPGRLAVQVGRLAAIGLLGSWIFYMGSRGALFGLLAGLVVLALLSERKRDITALPAWFITTCGCVVVVAATVLSQSSLVRDGDTRERGRILGRLWRLGETDPLRFLVGFGSSDEVTDASLRHLQGALVNPHNMVAETWMWAGIFGLIGFVVVWLYIARRAFRNETGRSWYALNAVAATLVMPLLGVTPSVILHYLFPQLLMIAAVATVEEAPSGAALPAGVEDHHRQHPRNTSQGNRNDQARQLP